MKKISQTIIASFLNLESVTLGPAKVIAGDGTASLWIHGMCIAVMIDGILSITTTGVYPTHITLDILNGLPGVVSSVMYGQTYLNGIAWDGKWIQI